MNSLWVTLIVIAIAIIVVLAVIAIRMQKQVKKMEAKKQQQQQDVEELKNNHQHYIHNSIKILAQGVLDEQVTLTEASIRISVLLDNLPEKEQYRENYSAFFQLADATAHIPILKAWKKLPTKEKLRFDSERQELEAKYKDFVMASAEKIREETFG